MSQGAQFLIAVAGAASLVMGCHRVSSSAQSEARLGVATCRSPHVSRGRIEVVRGAKPDTRLAGSSDGVLLVHANESRRGEARLVQNARVDVFSRGPQVPRFTRSARTDSLGWARLDSLAPGAYQVALRHPGYEMLTDRVEVRGGYVDTVRVHMWTRPGRLAPITTGDVPGARQESRFPDSVPPEPNRALIDSLPRLQTGASPDSDLVISELISVIFDPNALIADRQFVTDSVVRGTLLGAYQGTDRLSASYVFRVPNARSLDALKTLWNRVEADPCVEAAWLIFVKPRLRFSR